MMNSKVIAICGLKRSGKDTIADYLCNHHGYVKVKIASPLKDGLKCMFGFTDVQLETDMKDVVDERWGVEPRKIMQLMGTEVMQYQIQSLCPGLGRSFWIKRLVEEHIKTASHEKIVISDLRFKHEYDMLKEHNVVFLRVERENQPCTPSTECTHSSEREYLDIPVSHIFKNHDKKNLYEQVEKHLQCMEELNQI